MASYAEELESRDIGVLVIGFDELQTLDDMKRRLSSPFIFMRDASRAGYRTLGLGRAGLLEPTCTPMCCDHTPASLCKASSRSCADDRTGGSSAEISSSVATGR